MHTLSFTLAMSPHLTEFFFDYYYYLCCVYSPFLLSLNAPFHIRIQKDTREIILHCTAQHSTHIRFHFDKDNIITLLTTTTEKKRIKRNIIWSGIANVQERKNKKHFLSYFFVILYWMKTNLCSLACLVLRNNTNNKKKQHFKKEKYNLSYFLLFYCCLAFVIVELQFFSISAAVTAPVVCMCTSTIFSSFTHKINELTLCTQRNNSINNKKNTNESLNERFIWIN